MTCGVFFAFLFDDDVRFAEPPAHLSDKRLVNEACRGEFFPGVRKIADYALCSGEHDEDLFRYS